MKKNWKANLKVLWIFIKVKVCMLFKRSIRVEFILHNNNWYCNIPGWPKEYFNNTLMVGDASDLLSMLYCCTDMCSDKLVVTVYKDKPSEDVFELKKVTSSTTGGGIYTCLDYDHVWLCPVTLFVLGKFPETIYFK